MYILYISVCVCVSYMVNNFYMALRDSNAGKDDKKETQIEFL